MVYTITIAELELNNLLIPALDSAIQPVGYQAKSFIMAQIEEQNAQAEELAELQAASPDVIEAPVVDAVPQQAPDVAS